MTMSDDRRNAMWQVILGSLCVLSGAGVYYYFGYAPWRDATQAAPKVYLSFKALFAAPIVTVVGLAMLWPKKPQPPAAGDQTPKKPSYAVLWLMLLLIVVNVCYYFWLKAFLRSHGYDV